MSGYLDAECLVCEKQFDSEGNEVQDYEDTDRFVGVCPQCRADASSSAARRSPTRNSSRRQDVTSVTPYFIEASDSCPKCGPLGWNIIGPDGVSFGITYGEEEDAQEMADMLNEAFDAGMKTALLAGQRLHDQLGCGCFSEGDRYCKTCSSAIDEWNKITESPSCKRIKFGKGSAGSPGGILRGNGGTE